MNLAEFFLCFWFNHFLTKGLYIGLPIHWLMEQKIELKPNWEKICNDIEEHMKDPEYVKALDKFISLTS